MVPSAFVLLEELPLTPNGKIDRRALPAPDAAGPEGEPRYVAPSPGVEATLARIWAEVLGREPVGVKDNFFELGGDSILSIQVVARAQAAGLRVSAQQMFQYQTIAELAAVVGTGAGVPAEQGVVTGAVPLTPIQRWFFEHELAEPHHWNQALMLTVRQVAVPELLRRAVGQLVAHHDALRLRFVRRASGWEQTNSGLDEIAPFSWIDLSEESEAAQATAIEAAAAQLQASLSLSEGPLLRVALLDLGRQQASRLLIVIHHLAIDGVSWRILLEDLLTAYGQLSRGQAVKLPPKTTSFKQWAERLRAYAQTASVKAEMEYWLAEERSQVGPLPVDYLEGRSANTVASSRTVSVRLSEEETRALLHQVPEAYHTHINEVLLTALVQALSQWTGERRVLVDLEGHGREALFADVDVSRTVGWFTTVYPVLLEVRWGMDEGSALKAIKEQMRGMPNRGIGYGLLRYLSGDGAAAEALRRQPQAEVSFNYLGQLDQVLPVTSPFGVARESSGPPHSPRGIRRYLLEINGSVIEGRLQLVWIYSEQVHRRTTIERLAHGHLEALRALIAHCQSPEAGGFTPSDFSLARLDEERLSKLSSLIEALDESEL
jgi:non-ribosomal peptide synthase protein (TIGR01720 family)